MAEMTREAIEKCIKENDGYLQPHLNDQLFLHCKGFVKIEEVIGVYEKIKALWLQQNAISRITNLEKLTNLGCLYLHQNCISDMSGLSALKQLHTLNLSQNYITKIEGLADLPRLETLMLAHNRISGISGLKGVLEGREISCLDVSNNGLQADKEAGEEPEDVIKLLSQMPKLACLYIQGNDLPNQTRYFRRKMVGTIQSLTYMDERPVFPEDRRATNAWMTGGFEAEQAERDLIRQEKRAAEKENMEKYKAMQERGRALKEAREKELAELEEKRQEWLAQMKSAHEVERRRVIGEEEDGRTLVVKEDKGAAEKLELQREIELSAALTAERKRKESEAVRRQAELELQQEAVDQIQRRESYLKKINAESATREQELQFLEAEMQLLERREEANLQSQLQDIQSLTAPTTKQNRKTQHQRRHVDPFKMPSARVADIWSKYASWERRGIKG